jgi:hypothetical protein
MKGSLQTDELRAAVVNKDTGLRMTRRISHCFVMDVPMCPEALCKMADRGQIKGAILDGPRALDNAISTTASRASAWVHTTNEELMIARHTRDLLAAQ